MSIFLIITLFCLVYIWIVDPLIKLQSKKPPSPTPVDKIEINNEVEIIAPLKKEWCESDISSEILENSPEYIAAAKSSSTFLTKLERKKENGYYLNFSGGTEKYEHRQVAVNILGNLTKGSVVHHVNGEKTDNRPDNLCVLSATNHDKWHLWLKTIRPNYPSIEIQVLLLQNQYDSIHLGSKLTEVS